jgi:hypothetical protein
LNTIAVVELGEVGQDQEPNQLGRELCSQAFGQPRVGRDLLGSSGVPVAAEPGGKRGTDRG